MSLHPRSILSEFDPRQKLSLCDQGGKNMALKADVLMSFFA